jgi:type VI secretion system protein ImpH
MARQDRKSALDLKLGMLKEGHAFSFFQALRLLRHLYRSPSEPADRTAREEGDSFEAGKAVQVRPKLSLAFPPADVDRIEELDGEESRFSVTATFFGLYGTSSPLPTFYTEDLMDEEAADESVTREFIDVIHHRLYLLMFKCWTKYRLFLQVAEEENPSVLERLFCLIGLGENALQSEIGKAYPLLRYAGLFTQHPRSAVGLEALLQDALCVRPVRVIPGARRRSNIPVDQMFHLGSSRGRLGRTCFLGEEIEDRVGKFHVRIGPLDWDQYYGLLPGGEGYQKMIGLIKLYIVEPLEYDVELILREGQVKTACLGADESTRLGWDTWIQSGVDGGEGRVTFCPQGI